MSRNIPVMVKDGCIKWPAMELDSESNEPKWTYTYILEQVMGLDKDESLALSPHALRRYNNFKMNDPRFKTLLPDITTPDFLKKMPRSHSARFHVHDDRYKHAQVSTDELYLC